MGLPDQAAVVQTTLCLGSLVMRANLEEIGQRIGTAKAVELKAKHFDRLNDWMLKMDLNRQLSRKENILRQKSFGSWSMREIIDGSWRAECVGVMSWALSVFDALPAYDTEFSKNPVLLEQIGIGLHENNFGERARLRPTKEISKARNAAESWHWRARTTQLQKKEINPPGESKFPQIIKRQADLAFKKGFISKTMEDNFPLFGKSYAKLSSAEWQMAMSIAQERHFALNWLSGRSKNSDETLTDA